MKTAKSKKPDAVPKRLGLCIRAVEELSREAAAGSKEAVEELVEIGFRTTMEIDSIFGRNPELIREIAEKYERFPILYTYRKDENRERIACAKSLKLRAGSPFTTLGNLRLDAFYDAIDSQVSGKLEQLRKSGVRAHNRTQRRIARKIRNLAPISRGCVTAWADAFADYHLNFEGPPRMDRNDLFYQLASPDRELRTRQRKARERMEKRYGKAQDARNLDPIAATKREAWDKKIRAMTVTPNSFHRLLVEELSKRLLRMLRK
jgi:hypothetical protein